MEGSCPNWTICVVCLSFTMPSIDSPMMQWNNGTDVSILLNSVRIHLRIHKTESNLVQSKIQETMGLMTDTELSNCIVPDRSQRNLFCVFINLASSSLFVFLKVFANIWSLSWPEHHLEV